MTPTNNIAEESHCFSCLWLHLDAPDPPSCLSHPPLCNPATVTHISLCVAEVVENKRVGGWGAGAIRIGSVVTFQPGWCQAPIEDIWAQA